MKKIDCEIIQDLLPSYIEDLTHKKTNILIEDHLKECHTCQHLYHNLKGETIEEIQDIHFLKKVKRKNRIIIFCIIILFIISIIPIINNSTKKEALLSNDDFIFVQPEFTEPLATWRFALNEKLRLSDIKKEKSEKYTLYKIIARNKIIPSPQIDYGTIEEPTKKETQVIIVFNHPFIIRGHKNYFQENTVKEIFTVIQGCLTDYKNQFDCINYILSDALGYDTSQVTIGMYDQHSIHIETNFNNMNQLDIEFIKNILFYYDDSINEIQITFKDKQIKYKKENEKILIHDDPNKNDYEDFKTFYDSIYQK